MECRHLMTYCIAALLRQGVEALNSAADDGEPCTEDAAALQKILEAVQDLSEYEPEGVICSCTWHHIDRSSVAAARFMDCSAMRGRGSNAHCRDAPACKSAFFENSG